MRKVALLAAAFALVATTQFSTAQPAQALTWQDVVRDTLNLGTGYANPYYSGTSYYGYPYTTYPYPYNSNIYNSPYTSQYMSPYTVNTYGGVIDNYNPYGYYGSYYVQPRNTVNRILDWLF